MKKQSLGIVFALMTAILSGVAIPLNKIFVITLDPAVFTAVRAIIIGFLFLIISYSQGSLQVKKVKKLPWKYLITIAIIGGSLAFLLFFTGLKMTTSGRAAFLHKTLPIYVTIFAFLLLKDKIPRKHVYAMVLMLIGTVLIYSASIDPSWLWENPSFGDLLIISATILWGLEAVIAKKVMKDGETNFVVSFARMFFGGLILFGAVVLMGKADLLLAIGSQEVLNILISTGLLFGYVFFWYWSIKLMDVSQASTLLLLAPVISLVLGMAMLGEPVPNIQILGSILILIGSYFVIGIKSGPETGV
jgi:drug/metabolite transporter (DMT)-like permease